MKLKNLLIAFSFLFLSIGQASAAGLFEPSLGYAIHSKEKVSGPGFETESSGNPTVLGVNLGFRYFGIMGGLSYKHNFKTDYDFELNGQGGFEDEKLKRRDIGVFAGYNFPAAFRVWGSYYFDTRREQTTGSDAGSKVLGSSWGLGLGFTGLPVVNLNLEYIKTSFDEQEDPRGRREDIDSRVDAKMSQIILSVSIPFHF